ncbi:putative ATPase [Mycobacterium kansasii 662]|uniref:Putative ATPase n=1 Tax=Mycobacterium kansasii 662 TaxID=1299326 RepID=X7XR09_MYCKA|nr:putative ATPase [Mycobacterium kansasii 662]
MRLLHSDQTAIHLVTLLEALPMQETLEAIEELAEMQLRSAASSSTAIFPAYLSAEDSRKAAEGDVDADSVRSVWQWPESSWPQRISPVC